MEETEAPVPVLKFNLLMNMTTTKKKRLNLGYNRLQNIEFGKFSQDDGTFGRIRTAVIKQRESWKCYSLDNTISHRKDFEFFHRNGYFQNDQLYHSALKKCRDSEKFCAEVAALCHHQQQQQHQQVTNNKEKEEVQQDNENQVLKLTKAKMRFSVCYNGIDKLNFGMFYPEDYVRIKTAVLKQREKSRCERTVVDRSGNVNYTKISQRIDIELFHVEGYFANSQLYHSALKKCLAYEYIRDCNYNLYNKNKKQKCASSSSLPKYSLVSGVVPDSNFVVGTGTGTDIVTSYQYVASCIGCEKRFKHNSGLANHVKFCDHYKLARIAINHQKQQIQNKVKEEELLQQQNDDDNNNNHKIVFHKNKHQSHQQATPLQMYRKLLLNELESRKRKMAATSASLPSQSQQSSSSFISETKQQLTYRKSLLNELENRKRMAASQSQSQQSSSSFISEMKQQLTYRKSLLMNELEKRKRKAASQSQQSSLSSSSSSSALIREINQQNRVVKKEDEINQEKEEEERNDDDDEQQWIRFFENTNSLDDILQRTIIRRHR